MTPPNAFMNVSVAYPDIKMIKSKQCKNLIKSFSVSFVHLTPVTDAAVRLLLQSRPPSVEPQQKHISAIRVPQRRTEHMQSEHTAGQAQFVEGTFVLTEGTSVQQWSLQEYSVKVNSQLL
jgi:hypothetical protein